LLTYYQGEGKTYLALKMLPSAAAAT